ncbi:Transposase IS4 [Fragilaria crotonensis]|nr:Transposase IS4 [Fragilaria crotonensis]
MICVDESMSRWYGQGGHWINHGLPQYAALDRKPENGCEIQNAACGVCGVMLRLKLVKGANLPGVEDKEFADNSNSMLHGTRVLKHLVSPWFGSHRIVCAADSYFASVGAANELFRNGLRFIGVVKTATRGFPKQILTCVELQSRGVFLLSKQANATARTPALGAVVWMDRERRYLISTAGSFEAGTPYQRSRWRQVDQTPNAAPEQVVFTITQPNCEIYYSTCGSIDMHNRL